MRQRYPDLYPSANCLSCLRSTESQSHFWTCPSHQAQWHDILDKAADHLMQLFQKHKQWNLPSLNTILDHLHGSRSFIAKGLVSSSFYNFIYSIEWSLNHTDTTIAIVYNYIYRQVFTHLWKLRCVWAIAYEKILGISNVDKRSRHHTTRFNYQPTSHTQEAPPDADDPPSRPWVY